MRHRVYVSPCLCVCTLYDFTVQTPVSACLYLFPTNPLSLSQYTFTLCVCLSLCLSICLFVCAPPPSLSLCL